MQVWILSDTFHGHEASVMGVFSSKEKAQKALTLLKERNGNNPDIGYLVEEFQLDYLSGYSPQL